MAINTDTSFGKSALGERDVSNPTDFQDTEKLLSAAATEPTGQSNIKPSDSFTLNIRGSVHSLNAEQNGHRSPLKSGSVGQLAAPPKSLSRLSLGPLPSPVPPGSVPPGYFWLAVLSCFCPAVPLNICALWYANVVSFTFIYSSYLLHNKSIIMYIQCVSVLLMFGFILLCFLKLDRCFASILHLNNSLLMSGFSSLSR